MYTPTQSGYLFQNKLRQAFGLSNSQIRIVHLNTGGAFMPEMPITPWKVLRVIRQQ